MRSDSTKSATVPAEVNRLAVEYGLATHQTSAATVNRRMRELAEGVLQQYAVGRFVYERSPARSEAEVLADLERFGDVVTLETRPKDWISQVIATHFDGAEYSADYRRGAQFRTKLAAMESCLEMILQHAPDAADFLKASTRKANPSPGL